MLDLDGLILHHRDFGYCKITGQAESTVRVNFISTNRDSWYGIKVIAAQQDFKWRPLPVGLKCTVPDRGTCTIMETAFKPSTTSGVHEYLVAFDETDGLTSRLSERELRPIPGSLIETPKTKFVSLQVDPFSHYRSREGLRSSLSQLNQESDGISAMVGSRIELLPHQAFVVRNVLDDPLCRYILADEVGLGKTIEAGIIAHQLLADNPKSRILILTPSPLARQWLCEIRMSFVGRDFRLLDLHSPRNVSLKNWPLVISSLKVAMRSFKTQIEQANWDLVIVDEAHQLLWSQPHYEFVQSVAVRVSRLLLLSAVPARERAEELLRLLRLIEPTRYADGSLVATRFSELYAAQSMLGRRWRIFSRGVENGDGVDLEQLHSDALRLLSSPIVEQDKELHAFYQQAIDATSPTEALNLYRTIAEEVVARYRLSRRILKNRRTQLSEREMFQPVARNIEYVEYAPSDLEQEAEQLMLELLVDLAKRTQFEEPLYALTRKALQALCDPVALYEIATSVVSGSDDGRDIPSEFDSSWVFDYAEHDDLLSSLGDRYGCHLDPEKLQRWITILRAAIDALPQPRIAALDSCLDTLIAKGSKKILVFAGTPGTAEFLFDHLKDRYGHASTASFRHDLSDDDKEQNVAHFRNDSKCFILISDESGGEGRNFQIADFIVHFDLPWSVAAIEQRIGRLDRIGRTMPVRSIVICAKDSIESQWANCLADGFCVFTRSISGLEFMLRMQEQAILQVVLQSPAPDLQPMITQIFEASEAERAGDDAEAITDAASYKSRGYTLRAFRPNIDEHLERFVPGYMRSISRGDAARQVTDIKNANLKIWRLRPDDVTELKLPGMERDGDNPLRERFGTFNRLIARERQDLEFFSIGHPVVDALAHVMNHHVRGRSFIVSTKSTALPLGIYIYSQWKVLLNEKLQISERVSRLLGTRSVNVALDLFEHELLTDEVTKVLTRMLVSPAHNFSDMGTDKALEILLPEQGEWSQTINNLIEKSMAAAKDAYRQQYGHVDLILKERWLDDVNYVERLRPDEAEEYVFRGRQTIEALVNSRLELDVLGLIHFKQN